MPASNTCTFTNAKGHELSARLERPDGPTLATALFAHCFTCGIDLRVERRLTKALTDQGFAVLSFDFTGLGRSAGTFAESSFSANIDDLHAAAAYLAEIEAPPTLLVGHSLGGAAILAAAPAMASVQALATIGAPSDPGHVRALLDGDLDGIRRSGTGTVTIAGRTFELNATFLDELDTFNPVSTLTGFTGATLFMHAPLDNTVGIDNAEALYHAAKHPKSFISLDDADHLLTREEDSNYAATVIAAWSSRYLTSKHTEPTKTGTFADGGATASNAGGWPTALESRGFRLTSDQPAAKGGAESGPTPYDFISMALAACTAMTLRAYAIRKKWDIGNIDVTVTHRSDHADDCEKGGQPSAYMDRLDITLRVSSDVTDEQRTALLRIAGRCPVHLTLTAPVKIDIKMSDATSPT